MLAFHTAELPGNPVELDFKSGKIVQSNFFAQNASIFWNDLLKLNRLKPQKNGITFLIFIVANWYEDQLVTGIFLRIYKSSFLLYINIEGRKILFSRSHRSSK